MAQRMTPRSRVLVVGLGALTLAGVAGAERIARFGLRLGEPPLTVTDPEMECLFEPGHYRPLGNDARYNRYHILAGPPPAADNDRSS